MHSSDDIGRRGFLAGVLSGMSGAALAGSPKSGTPPSPPADLSPGSPLALLWNHPIREIAVTDLKKVAPELEQPEVKERHRIYAGLLSALICRFWNGNNKGPVGIYPWREKQRGRQVSESPIAFHYHGDTITDPDANRVNWDRYLGHNIACLAVDATGEIIDFDFNHNQVMRSTVEHAESRLVRRLFSLTNVFDSWQTGARIPGKSASFSLTGITIYTSLESCAQCSGIMALGRVKQVVYLQGDPGQYRVGNLMFNLAGKDSSKPPLPLAALPIPASELNFDTMAKLESAYTDFANAVQAADGKDRSRAYFIPPDSRPLDYDSGITSFLCTDGARAIFGEAAQAFSTMSAGTFCPEGSRMTNADCLQHARDFYRYADLEGYRGSPHKL